MNLYIYGHLTGDSVIKNLMVWRENGDSARYYAACGGLLNAHMGLRDYIGGLLLEDAPDCGLTESWAYFDHDIHEIYENLIGFDWDELCQESGLLPLPEFDLGDTRSDYCQTLQRLKEAVGAEAFGGILADFFDRYACADEAKYAAFKWRDGRLAGVSAIDGIAFDDLGGLGEKKDILMANTEVFLDGRPAHDVLLVGASGTGKSSSVKAVFNLFRPRGLKLAEIFKEDIAELPRLMELIKKRKQRYIVFIDDLSFDGSDADYKALKVTLDGQVEERPGNMLLYATSNRVHLVRETWKDRDWAQDIHDNETLHEKLSLSERFGIRLYFPVLSQPEYFEIVALLLAKRGVAFDEEIGKRAVAWELGNNGRSGRTARQFVKDYLSRRGNI